MKARLLPLLVSGAILMPTLRAAITDHLVAHLRFDQSLEDSSGRTNHGAAVGNVTFGAGKVGSGAANLSFRKDGSSFNFVTVTTSINATDVASGVIGVAKNNKITLPESALNIDGIDSSDVVQLGSRLYDKETNDIFFTDLVTVTYTALIEFDCLPEAFARFVMYTAAERFAAVYASNKSTIGYIGMKLRDAEAACNRADLNSSDFNVLDSTFARDIRGQRPRRTASLGLWYGV
jgi:hypothetical protein